MDIKYTCMTSTGTTRLNCHFKAHDIQITIKILVPLVHYKIKNMNYMSTGSSCSLLGCDAV